MTYNVNNWEKKEFNEKLDRIVEQRFASSKADTSNKQYRAFYSAYRESFNNEDISSDVRAWRSFKGQNENKLPSIKQLMNLCSVLKCDIDYFLGAQNNFSKNITGASEVTGLSETTIEELSGLSTAEKHIIDVMFSRSASGINLIRTIREMLFYSHPSIKNKTQITLDRELTSREHDYEELESDLHEYEVRKLLSYKLSIEMNNIVETLSDNKDLEDEILADYLDKKRLYFHTKPLKAEYLPCLLNPTLDDEIIKEEQKILDRLEERDRLENKFDYGVPGLNTYKDFCHMIQEKRNPPTEDYLLWLKDIEKKTR